MDAVDGAAASMAGMTSQPALSSIVSAMDHTDRATPLSLSALLDLEPYWEAVRTLYAPFESGLRAPTGRAVPARDPRRPALQPAPAGDRARAGSALRGDRARLRKADPLLGHIVKVDADEQGRRRSRAVRRVGRDRLGRAARAPAGVRPARLRAGVPPRRAGRARRRASRSRSPSGRCGRRRRRPRRTAERRATRRARTRRTGRPGMRRGGRDADEDPGPRRAGGSASRARPAAPRSPR